MVYQLGVLLFGNGGMVMGVMVGIVWFWGRVACTAVVTGVRNEYGGGVVTRYGSSPPKAGVASKGNGESPDVSGISDVGG